MFAEHAFDVKHLGRRRAAVATIALAALTLVLTVGRPDRVPPGEANPWPSRGEVLLPAELPGVYVVQPGDTLWDIALAIAPGDDPRALVHDLAEATGGTALEPGQRIAIGAEVDAEVEAASTVDNSDIRSDRASSVSPPRQG